MEYKNESLSDEEFTIIEDELRGDTLNRRLRILCNAHGDFISITDITNNGYDRLRAICEDVPEKNFEGCIMSKQDLSSILSRYKNRYLEPIRKSKELRKTLESDLWGGIEGLFISVDDYFNRIIEDRYGRLRYPLSEMMRLVNDGIITVGDITDFASLIDYSNRGLMDITPKNPDPGMIDSWIRLLGKLNDIESRRFR